MWRSARDSGVFISAMKLSRSRRSASSIGLLTDIATASTHFSGAGKFFDVAPTVLRANCRNASDCGSFTLRSRTRLSGSLSATTLSASAIAAATGSPSTTSSNSAVPFSLAAGTVAPETIMLSAASRPITRGSRWVPPAPGNSPSFTSGSAICASDLATR